MAAVALRELGPSYRPFGPPRLIDALVEGIPGLRVQGAFGWMDTTCGVPVPGGPVWLTPDGAGDVTRVIEDGFPSSYAAPGVSGVERWAGIRDTSGELVAVAALAWSAPRVGFLSGVAVAPAARGRGLGREVCAFVTAAAVEAHGTAALMVDEWNGAAIRLYESLGFTYRPVAAAGFAA
ncbi:conserved protein of unknown function (plasmid) [Streptantibioticus cattleyicolor NRRL 8057 = DSM 46488]|nr:conserved protein of unknown function [Streptantibioticus cattleyicolor NRRL 8057 = DSM 46488]